MPTSSKPPDKILLTAWLLLALRDLGEGHGWGIAFEHVMAWFACRFPDSPANSHRAPAAAYRGEAEFPPVPDQG